MWKGESIMIKKMRERLKNQKGLTLIELLAVVVILGIIAAIAIPSIGGLIDNTKKDAHVANAQQMINAAKIAVSSDKEILPAGKTKFLPLKYLEDSGYLETLVDPDGDETSYDRGGDKATETTPDVTDSYVAITMTNNKLSYEVQLVGSKRKIEKVKESGLKRSAVKERTVSGS